MIKEEWIDFRGRLSEIIENVISPLKKSGWTSSQEIPWIKRRFASSQSTWENFPPLKLTRGDSFISVTIPEARSKDFRIINCEWNFEGSDKISLVMSSVRGVFPSKPNSVIEVLGKIRWNDSDYKIDGINPNIPEVLKMKGSIKAAADWYAGWGYQYKENETSCQGADNIGRFIVSELILHRNDLDGLHLKSYLVDGLRTALFDYGAVKGYTTSWEQEITATEHKELVKLLWNDIRNTNDANLPIVLLSYINVTWRTRTITKTELNKELGGAFEILCERLEQPEGIVVLNDTIFFTDASDKLFDPEILKNTIDRIESLDSTFESFSSKDGNLSTCEKKAFSDILGTYRTLRSMEDAHLNKKSEILRKEGYIRHQAGLLLFLTILGAWLGYMSWGVDGIMFLSGLLTICIIILPTLVFVYYFGKSKPYYVDVRLKLIEKVFMYYWFIWAILIPIPSILLEEMEITVLITVLSSYVLIYAILMISLHYFNKSSYSAFNRNPHSIFYFTIGIGIVLLLFKGGDLNGIFKVPIYGITLTVTFPEICVISSVIVSWVLLAWRIWYEKRQNKRYGGIEFLFESWTNQGSQIHFQIDTHGYIIDPPPRHPCNKRLISKILKKMGFTTMDEGFSWTKGNWSVNFAEATV